MNDIVIHYGPVADGSGLVLANDYLELHHRGARLLARPCAGTDLQSVLDDFAVLDIYPEVSFAYTRARTESYEIDMLIDLVTSEEASGTAACGEPRRMWAWEARRVNQTAGVAQGWEDMWGGPVSSRWGFRLDPMLTGGDPVLWARLAAALEEMLLARELGRPLIVPQRREVTNVFSALTPPWPRGCPPDLDHPERAPHHLTPAVPAA